MSNVAESKATDAEPKATELFAHFTKILEQFKVPGIDMKSLIEARRNDIAALTQANKVVYDGMQELVRKQTEILRVTMEGMQTTAKEMVKGSQTATPGGQPKEVLEQAVQKALANMRELAELVVKTQTEAFSIISNRVVQDVKDMKTLVQSR
jgi:phasin family protein